MPFLTVLAALSGLALLVLVGLTLSPRYRAARARQMSTSVGLALDDSVRPRVERALAVRLRTTGVGAVIGLALGWAAMTAWPIGSFSQWFMLAGLFLGIGAGSAVGAFLARPRATPAGPRIARSRDVTLGDYVAPIELTGARILVGAAVSTGTVVAVLLIGNPRETTSLVSLVVVTLLAAGALVVFEVAGRAIIAQPSPAQDPTSLAWEDALRAETLRNLVTTPLMFGCVAVALTVVGAFGTLPLNPVTIVVGTVVPMLLLLAALTIAVVAMVSRPQRHFLRRLWPETAAAAR